MEKKFDCKAFMISYEDDGSGMPVVLLHGFGEDSRIWDEQVTFLKSKCRLIVPELPGSAGSMPIGSDMASQILNGLPASITAMADAISILLNKEGIEKCVLLGHSMGGYITLAFAEKYPEKLLGFGLIHSTAFADTEEKKATRRKGIEFVKKNGGFAFLQTAIPGLFTETFKKEQPGKVAALIEQFNPEILSSTTTDAAIIAYYEAMIDRQDRTEVLKSSGVPVLFIIGAADKAVLMEDVLKQVHLPQVSQLHIIEHCAHISMMEHPGLLNQYLGKFVTEIEKLNKS